MNALSHGDPPHVIEWRNESHSQIPYCGRCNRDLTDDEIRRLVGSRETTWTTVELGVMSWDDRVGAYVLRIPRRDDLPLSFNVETSVGHEAT